MVPPKQWKKRIIEDDEDESNEEPLIPVLSRKGKEEAEFR